MTLTAKVIAPPAHWVLLLVSLSSGAKCSSAGAASAVGLGNDSGRRGVFRATRTQAAAARLKHPPITTEPRTPQKSINAKPQSTATMEETAMASSTAT